MNDLDQESSKLYEYVESIQDGIFSIETHEIEVVERGKVYKLVHGILNGAWRSQILKHDIGRLFRCYRHNYVIFTEPDPDRAAELFLEHEEEKIRKTEQEIQNSRQRIRDIISWQAKENTKLLEEK